jgi:hypothetical protein
VCAPRDPFSHTIPRTTTDDGSNHDAHAKRWIEAARLLVQQKVDVLVDYNEKVTNEAEIMTLIKKVGYEAITLPAPDF